MENLFLAFTKRLNAISQEEDNVLKREKRSIELCIVTLTELKALTSKKGFTSKKNEIDFFKNTKPRFESQLKYHIALFEIEKHKPLISIQAQREYFDKKLNEVEIVMQSDVEFYTYYKTGSTHFDDLYFTRCVCPVQLALQSCVFDIDMKFRSSHDHKVAEIIANEMVYNHLLQRIDSLNPEKTDISQGDNKLSLPWTESKAALIELIYALIYQGAFGNTDLDIKQIAAGFENLFNIDLSDLYRTYHDIKARKSSRTKFLDSMKENFIRQLDFGEEFQASPKTLF